MKAYYQLLEAFGKQPAAPFSNRIQRILSLRIRIARKSPESSEIVFNGSDFFRFGINASSRQKNLGARSGTKVELR